MCLKHMVKVVLILLKYSYDIALYHLVLIVLCEFNYRTRLFVVNTVSYFCTTDDFIIDTCSLRRLRIVGLFPLHDHCMVFTSFSSFLPWMNGQKNGFQIHPVVLHTIRYEYDGLLEFQALLFWCWHVHGIKVQARAAQTVWSSRVNAITGMPCGLAMAQVLSRNCALFLIMKVEIVGTSTTTTSTSNI